MLLYILLVVEVIMRVCLQVRECRQTQCRFDVFAVLRLIPLVNDIVPLPENRSEPEVTSFVEKHEEGHRYLRHAILRNLVKVALLLVAVWFLAFQFVRNGLPIFQAVLWLHLVAIPFRIFFNLYCWNQEYEADKYALKKVGKIDAKDAMRKLIECEIPYTKLFAVVYREHPTAVLRKNRILNKINK